ncbi:hypothetical protein N8739_10585 [Luminiphilus sp.]|nr:hypothetical protein [Luminiphilus sp.]
MICSACGAPLSVLKCQYCGHLNTAESTPGANAESEALEEKQYEIDSLESRIEKLQGMPMPEAMKTKKIEILEKELMELVSK